MESFKNAIAPSFWILFHIGIVETRTKTPAVKETVEASQLIAFFNNEETVSSNSADTAKTITGNKAHHTISGVETGVEAKTISRALPLIPQHLFLPLNNG